MNDKLKVIRIKEILEDEGQVTAEELIIQIADLFPEKIKIVEPPPQTSDERLEYMRKYREEKKMYDRVKSEEEKKALKIKKALSRTKQLCFHCKNVVQVINPVHTIIKKRNRTNEQIQVSFDCPNCGKVVKYSGGNI